MRFLLGQSGSNLRLQGGRLFGRRWPAGDLFARDDAHRLLNRDVDGPLRFIYPSRAVEALHFLGIELLHIGAGIALLAGQGIKRQGPVQFPVAHRARIKQIRDQAEKYDSGDQPGGTDPNEPFADVAVLVACGL
jgi:hypothetical protein